MPTLLQTADMLPPAPVYFLTAYATTDIMLAGDCPVASKSKHALLPEAHFEELGLEAATEIFRQLPVHCVIAIFPRKGGNRKYRPHVIHRRPRWTKAMELTSPQLLNRSSPEEAPVEGLFMNLQSAPF